MKPDTSLILGDFLFARFEIPEKIGFGGDHKLAVHELVGGQRVIDAMGRSDAPLEWSGILTGPTALERARYLDNLRVAGKELLLTWSEFSYFVIVQSFRCSFERAYKLPYTITCIVVEDATSPVKTIASPGVDEAMRDDMTSATTLGTSIGDVELSGLLATLDTAISAVSSFATVAQSTINSVLQPLAAVQTRVGILLESVGNTVTNVTTLGGILPNNPISQQATNLLGQVNAMQQLPVLYNLRAVTGRMVGNLGTVGSGVKTLSLAGGNLFSVAAQEYGDATAWTGIAQANNLTDPQLAGVNTLTIPPNPTTGGVLTA
jgi:hypothetical protein